VPTPSKRPERVILKEIKDRVNQHFGVLDLLDVLAEVDRRVDLVSHFQTTGQRRVVGEEETRKRLLFVLFSLGTNLGLKRLHSAARPDCSYDDLRYFMRRFITPEALKEANVSLVNLILELRDSKLWGDGTSCASDGKFLAAWDKNITAEWNPHYKGRGVKVYWHVEQGAVAIHSMLKTPSCTEVAPMIEGVVHHGTLAAIETNCVDTGGQSLPAFGLCRPLQFELLPRFRQVKRFQLNLPYKEMASKLPALSGVTTRSIRWDLIEEHYDDYARHAAAILERTGPVESILRRFTRNNRPHPTYKALLEIGRAERTIYLCRLLSEPDLHVKVHDQLNGIEHWNSCNQFICFARRSELRTNDPVMQELIVGSLHLLQNAMVLANTLMMERVITNDVLERMTTEDIYSLTPLFTSSINPYGEFDLDLNKPSFLEAV
jgi:TnpA family transposase